MWLSSFQFSSGFQVTVNQTKMVATSSCSSSIACDKITTSDYFNGLESNVKTRYSNKIPLCNGIDPYSMKKGYKRFEAYNFFLCGWVHDVGFKVLQDSNRLAFARVSHVVDIWIRYDTSSICISYYNIIFTYVFLFTYVNHSQRSTAKPLKTWVIIKEDGEVIMAHCNCMAG